MEKFLNSYSAAGAEHIYLYFDGTVDEAAELQSLCDARDDAFLTVCDRSFWIDAFGEYDANLDVRMVHVFRLAIERNTSDWLLFCDADEFLQCDAPLGSYLEKLPADVPAVRLRNTEAVWSTGDDADAYFSSTLERLPFPAKRRLRPLLGMLVYGRAWREMSRGTSGHDQGKHLLRRDVVPERISSHTSKIGGRNAKFLDQLLPGDTLPYIRHFDSICFERWLEKWKIRQTKMTIVSTISAGRSRQMEAVWASISDGRARQVFRRYNQLNFWQRFILFRLGLLRRI